MRGVAEMQNKKRKERGEAAEQVTPRHPRYLTSLFLSFLLFPFPLHSVSAIINCITAETLHPPTSAQADQPCPPVFDSVDLVKN